MLCVEEEPPIFFGQRISNMQTIWQLSAGAKSQFLLKIYIFWDMADSIQYLVPTQFKESFLPPQPFHKFRLWIS
jgi:hypothetical protein